MKLYALHDKKSRSLSSFHAAKSDAVASRDFAQAVVEPKSLLGKYPEDFELVALAVLEEELDAESDHMGGRVEEIQPYAVVLTAKQVMDLQPKVGQSSDPAQLALLKEA